MSPVAVRPAPSDATDFSRKSYNDGTHGALIITFIRISLQTITRALGERRPAPRAQFDLALLKFT